MRVIKKFRLINREGYLNSDAGQNLEENTKYLQDELVDGCFEGYMDGRDLHKSADELLIDSWSNEFRYFEEVKGV